MPTLNNPYSFDSPFADSLSTLAKAFASGPDEATKRVHAETALKLARQRQGNEALAGNMRNLGTPMWDQNNAIANAFLADKSPELVGIGQRVQTANTYGAADPRTVNAQVGAGGAYNSTADAFKQTHDQDARFKQATLDQADRHFNDKPTTIGTPTGPQIARQSESYGKPAVEDLSKVKGDYARRAINQPGGLDSLPDSGKIFVGADKDKQPQPHNYIVKDTGEIFQTYDGNTDARTGAPLPRPGAISSVMATPDQAGIRPSVQGDLQKSNIALTRLTSVTDYARGLINPKNVGVAGMVKGLAQDAVQMADGLAQGLGIKSAQDAIVDMQRRATAQGADPNTLAGLFTFDPKLPQLSTAYYAMTMAGADALAGGMNKASDRDVKLIKNMLGDPESLFANPQYLNAKLDAVNELVGRLHGVNNTALRGGQPSAAAAPAAPGAPVPQPPAPGAPQNSADPFGLR